MSADDLYEFDARVVHETESAVLLDVGQDEPLWIPRSVLTEVDADDGTFAVPEWFAEEHDII